MNPLSTIRTKVRYFLFPESRVIDEKTVKVDQEIQKFKRQKDLTKEIVRSANQPDVLRNLVIAMSKERES